MSKPSYTFHLIGNSHLDPVWLWDWKEGVNESLITVRAILGLMDEFPKLTYTRGEAVVYQHVEKHDPESFAKIRRHVRSGRWDVVGGTYVQPDTNMTGTETMVRHFLRGQRYFQAQFGRVPRVAWAADSFGHSAGLPAIYSAAGIRYFAFFRPPQSQFPLNSPAFWWRGQDGSRILSYRPLGPWYGCERDELPRRLDLYLTEAAKYPFRNIAMFFGLGNHGGGPSRRHLEDLEEWLARHPEVEGRYSGLHHFFEELEKEIPRHAEKFRPEITGELNFTMRGTYATGAKFKFRYRKAEARLVRAETMASAIAAAGYAKAAPLDVPWTGVLFNSFHDILPATCTERALNEQISWVEGIVHQSQETEFEALNALGNKVNAPQPKTTADHPGPVTFLVWNPQPYRYTGPLELEAALDYRPIFSYQGRMEEFGMELRDFRRKPVPFQRIRVEHNFMSDLPWRQRVVFDADLPPLGWSIYTLGWVEKPVAAPVSGPVAQSSGQSISNEFYTLKAAVGAKGIRVLFEGKPVFSGAGLGLQTMKDAFGPWGNHYEEKDAEDISTVQEEWQITRVLVVEKGPIRSALWVRFEAGKSTAEFFFQLHRGRPVVDVLSRVFWNEPRRRLKLVMPGVGTEAEYEVPGGTVRRGSLGEVPGGRWVRVDHGRMPFGFASDALYNFDLKKSTISATIVRSSRHAMDTRDTDAVPEFVPVIDSGEYVFRFLFTADAERLPRLSDELEAAPVSLPIAAKKGKLEPAGSILEVKNANLRLLACKPAADGKGWILRFQENAGRKTAPSIRWLKTSLKLPIVLPFSIATYRLTRSAAKWSADRVPLNEL